MPVWILNLPSPLPPPPLHPFSFNPEGLHPQPLVITKQYLYYEHRSKQCLLAGVLGKNKIPIMIIMRVSLVLGFSILTTRRSQLNCGLMLFSSMYYLLQDSTSMRQDIELLSQNIQSFVPSLFLQWHRQRGNGEGHMPLQKMLVPLLWCLHPT